VERPIAEIGRGGGRLAHIHSRRDRVGLTTMGSATRAQDENGARKNGIAAAAVTQLL